MKRKILAQRIGGPNAAIKLNHWTGDCPCCSFFAQANARWKAIVAVTEHLRAEHPGYIEKTLDKR